MSNYDTTFNNRVDTYLYAQKTYKNVMKYEFETAIKLCNITNGDIFINIPDDSAFKTELLKENVEYVSFEFSEKFALLSDCNLCSINSIPFESKKANVVLSLSGLHHFSISDRYLFYKECKRIMLEDGIFVVGEVLKDSKQDKWLNEYVNKFNSNGHNGMFFTNEEKNILESLGFAVEIFHKEYPWIFDSVEKMCDYCINLFGLDNVNHDTILEDISKYLDYTINEDGSCQFMWSLIFFRSTISQV